MTDSRILEQLWVLFTQIVQDHNNPKDDQRRSLLRDMLLLETPESKWKVLGAFVRLIGWAEVQCQYWADDETGMSEGTLAQLGEFIGKLLILQERRRSEKTEE